MRGRTALVLMGVVLIAALGFALARPVSSTPPPSWTKVADGAWVAVWASDERIAYVPASSRLLTPQASAGAVSNGGEVQVPGGVIIPASEEPPEADAPVSETVSPFIFELGARADEVPTEWANTEQVGLWVLREAGNSLFVTDLPGGARLAAISPLGEFCCRMGQTGEILVEDAPGERHPLAGLPADVAAHPLGWIWGPSGCTLYVAGNAGQEIGVWRCPVDGSAELCGTVAKPFGGFAGVTDSGPLVYRFGETLSVVSQVSSSSLPLSSADIPWVVSPGGRYVLWFSDSISITEIATGKQYDLPVPRGYSLCPPLAWPGTDDLFVFYVCGDDPSDTQMVAYARKPHGEGFQLIASCKAPTPDTCFDYSVDPVMVGDGVFSVLITDSVGFLRSQAIDSSTWLVEFHAGGGR